MANVAVGLDAVCDWWSLQTEVQVLTHAVHVINLFRDD